VEYIHPRLQVLSGRAHSAKRYIFIVKDYDAIVYRDSKRGNMTCLLSAIFLDSLKTVQKLHQAGANIFLPAMGRITRTPLQAAAQVGSKDIVEYLLGHGASPNEPPSKRAGATALQLAAITGNINIATILLEAGAAINAPPAFCDGRTAFEGATEHGRIEMMIFLVRNGANLLANNNEQYRRAVTLAEDNRQYAAKALADDLYTKLLASQGVSFIGVSEEWTGPDMTSFEGFFP
jgi:ankyrin repeat protein